MKKRAFVIFALAIALRSAGYAQMDCSTLTFLTESLPDFTLGQPVHFDLEASGGTLGYTFAVTGDALPPGFTSRRMASFAASRRRWSIRPYSSP